MAKKEFGSVVTSEVARPVSKHKEETTHQPIVPTGKVKMQLDETNATKRTFFVRNELIQAFDMYAVSHRIDKGALLNIMMGEWLKENENRTEFV